MTLKALEEINLRDLKTITLALYEHRLTLKHDDEKALLWITLEKVQKALIEQEEWLKAEYSKENW